MLDFRGRNGKGMAIVLRPCFRRVVQGITVGLFQVQIVPEHGLFRQVWDLLWNLPGTSGAFLLERPLWVAGMASEGFVAYGQASQCIPNSKQGKEIYANGRGE